MSEEDTPGAGSPYHHGDLRRALLDAASDILAETGQSDFSLREVARRAGVSHNAPYRHFPDKEALLSEVGVLGYARLRTSGAAAVEGLQDPPSILAALGSSYIAFGLANPALYRLMFGQALPRVEGLSPTLLGAIDTARAILRDVIVSGARDGSFRIDPDDPAQVRTATVGAWSIVHGLTMLMIDQVVRPDAGSDLTDYLSEDVVELFVDGLASGC